MALTSCASPPRPVDPPAADTRCAIQDDGAPVDCKKLVTKQWCCLGKPPPVAHWPDTANELCALFPPRCDEVRQRHADCVSKLPCERYDLDGKTECTEEFTALAESDCK